MHTPQTLDPNADLEPLVQAALRIAHPHEFKFFPVLGSSINGFAITCEHEAAGLLREFGSLPTETENKEAIEALMGFHLLIQEGETFKYYRCSSEEELDDEYFQARDAMKDWSNAVLAGEADPPLRVSRPGDE